MLQQIPRLALQHLADGFQGGEAYGLGLPRLAGVMPIRSASSFKVILRRAIIISRFTTMGMDYSVPPFFPSSCLPSMISSQRVRRLTALFHRYMLPYSHAINITMPTPFSPPPSFRKGCQMSNRKIISAIINVRNIEPKMKIHAFNFVLVVRFISISFL